MYDAALEVAEAAAGRMNLLDRLGIEPGRYVLATIHRAENTDHPVRLAKIVVALEAVSQLLPVILPLHPRTAGALSASGLVFQRVQTILPPLGYLDMAALASRATVIAADSGGVQKDAFFYRVPCVTLRDETEWTELIEAGWDQLAPIDNGQAIAAAILNARGRQGDEVPPSGDGDAAGKIVARLVQ